MIDDDLVDARAEVGGDRRNEPVHLAVEPQPARDVAAIRLEHASVVVHVNAGDRADQPVGRHRRDPPHDEVVLAVVPPAGDEVTALFELGDEARDVARIVLAIRIERCLRRLCRGGNTGSPDYGRREDGSLL